MDPKKEHKKMYKNIPTFECESGCNACCGPVPMSDWEAKRLGSTKGITGTDENGTCEYSSPTGCTVYKDRPLTCRMFGAVGDSRLACPKLRMPKKPLTRSQGESLRGTYITVVTHELFKKEIGRVKPEPNVLELKA